MDRRNLVFNLSNALDHDGIQSLRQINTRCESFFTNSDVKYIAYVEEALDYLSVISIAKRKLFESIDLLHVGFPGEFFSFKHTCLAVGSQKPHFSRPQQAYYSTDGSYKSSHRNYLSIQRKLSSLLAKAYIANETKQKITSALRHLRLGREAEELEQKFIHYWIGLEYIFSDYDVAESSIKRLKTHFVNAHALAYIKRNYLDFHADLSRCVDPKTGQKVSESIADYIAQKYLTQAVTYDALMASQLQDHPLLAFRAYKLKQLLGSHEKVEEHMKNHRNNLTWHLTRCYRIRNEIVHDAAIHLNIELITGNLMYYLTFTVNALIEFLTDAPQDINMDGAITINDFFIQNEIQFENIKAQGLNVPLLMEQKSATEVFF